MLDKREEQRRTLQNERREAKKALKQRLAGRVIEQSIGPNRAMRRMRPPRYARLWKEIVKAARFRGITIHRRDYRIKQFPGLLSRFYPAGINNTFGFHF